MRRALILFGNEVEREALVDTAVYLKRNMNFEVEVLYVKEIDKEKVLATPTGLDMMGRMPVMLNAWNDIEKAEVDAIQNLFRKKDEDIPVVIEIGTISEVVTERMKSFDMLVLGKNEVLSDRDVTLLKINYKTIMLIGQKPLVSTEKVFIANDNGVKVNRSCYQFTNLFPEITEFLAYAINKDVTKNTLVEYMVNKGKKVTHEKLESKEIEAIISKLSEADLLVMGTLSRSYFIEKIVGKNGVKIMERCKAPIFIG